jgi:hypothetical protein
MSTIRSTISAAIAVSVISASALFATTGSSMAGGYGYGYGNGYGYGYQLVYQPRCYWTKVKVWTHYGWQWQKIKVCD